MALILPASGGGIAPLIRATDASIANSTTLVLDDTLRAAFAGGSAQAAFLAVLIFNVNGLTTFPPSFGVAAPSGAIVRAAVTMVDATSDLGAFNYIGGISSPGPLAAGILTESTIASLITNTGGGNAFPSIVLQGTIRGNSCAAGNIGIDWAQSNANGNPSVLMAGSFIQFFK